MRSKRSSRRRNLSSQANSRSMVRNRSSKMAGSNRGLRPRLGRFRPRAFGLMWGSARINLAVGEAEAGGNHLMEFREFESLPVKPSQQPEPSLACESGNALLEA